MSRELSLALTATAFVLAFSVALGGCATVVTGGSKGGAFCDVARPLTPSAGDAETISIGLGRQVIAHNRFGEQNCGWKP